MGIIVLALAILPLLGVGGMQLYRAEAPGTISDDSFKPRITETAKTLWIIYLGLTVLAALCFWLAGMPVFDAICHSLSTVAIGGFSTHDGSIGYFQNQSIETVAIIFMLVAGINFALHYKALHAMWASPRRSRTETESLGKWLKYLALSPWRWGSQYFASHEVRSYLGIIVMLILLVLMKVLGSGSGGEISARQVIFQAVSFATTTGFTPPQTLRLGLLSVPSC